MIALGCALVALGILTLPLGPRGHLHTRDYSDAPQWHAEAFNAAILLLTVAALAGAVFVFLNAEVARPLAVVFGLLEIVVLVADRTGLFPRTRSSTRAALTILELISLALAGVVIVLSFV